MGNRFDAHYIDAAAGAMPGETGVNERVMATHSVLIETSTATWCPYCPAMDTALDAVFEKNELPFYYVALIHDMSEVAADYLEETYNVMYFPTAYLDGGRRVQVGSTSESRFEGYINDNMQQDAHEFDLRLSTVWNNNQLEIALSITNLEEGDVSPPDLQLEAPKEGFLYLFDKEILPLPFDNSIVVGKLTIKVDAEDDVGMSHVNFKINDETVYTNTESPYEYEYDGAFGSQTLTIEAFDVNGNVAAEHISLYVINI